MTEVRALGMRRNNAELIVDLHALDYIRDGDFVLDPTYGYGRWWKKWKPDVFDFVAMDLHPLNDTVQPGDFTQMRWAEPTFDVVAFDPPYKLSGTSNQGGPASSDRSYGIDKYMRWQDRHELIENGIVECARVCKRTLLIKCMDQVCSGAVRWQTHTFTETAKAMGFHLVDKLHVQGYRKQPSTTPCKNCKGEGLIEIGFVEQAYYGDCPHCNGVGSFPREQEHARRDYSTMLVLERNR